jgi:uncharacterized membrane protein
MLAVVTRRCRYTLPGCWVALIFGCLAFTPSLLPRPALFQGTVTGIDAAIGYGLGVLGAWVWREFADRGPRSPSGRSWRVFFWVGGLALVVSLILGQWWQRQAHELVDTSPEGWAAVLLIPMVVALFFVALVAVARAVRSGYRRLSDLLARHMGARAARALGLVLLVAVGVLMLNGILWNGVISAVDRSLAVGDRLTPDDVAVPTTGIRSGGPGSLIDWDTMGREGRVFEGRGPNADDIEAVTGERAQDPIRIYSGFDSADDTEARADLAVRDLERAGGFERAAMLVVTTTGTGWVEPSSVGAFEYLTGGNSATISMQYSHLPSWLSFLVDQARAREAGRQLFDSVYEIWSQLPREDRPRLYVFGESLGSFGGETAFSGAFDLNNRTDGTLFVGPPNFNPLYRSFVEDREPESSEILPVYRDGRTIRFTDRPRTEIAPAGQPWPTSRVLYMQHPSDPITWWSPHLILHRPDWLKEPRGNDVLDATRWIPFVTFWQVSADLALGFSTEPGHGHNFTGEHVDGWAAVMQPEDWTAKRAEQLRNLAQSGAFSKPFAASSRG